ncbi:MAG: GYDIA family GHMP kinase [Saprospiraceae bacterium]|nr:GYDIA family GHMP kinase [Saprospiraceae bacterium]
MDFSMRANGKLLLTGEYFVTEGAVALALPTKLGQRISVKHVQSDTPTLLWQSYDENDELWFEAKFHKKDLELLDGPETAEGMAIADRLQEILGVATELNEDFLLEPNATEVSTYLEFPRHWGLGTSSTLITMVAKWAKVDPFKLLEETFGGSGYDIAAATADAPILFRKFNGRNEWDVSRFDPSFKEQLFFVHLNKKQDSREALVHYKVTAPEDRARPLPRISQITHNVAAYVDSLEEFEALMEEHEELVQSIVQQPRAKENYFSDYWGEIKSLGAWGGDFVLATSNRSVEDTKAYFEERGYKTVLSYDELIKH